MILEIKCLTIRGLFMKIGLIDIPSVPFTQPKKFRELNQLSQPDSMILKLTKF